MKEIKSVFNDIIKDYKDEDYTTEEWVYYGVILPLALIALCILSGFME